MDLLVHITVALSSLACSTYLLVAPSKTRFKVSYSLVALTLVSGTYLTLSHPSHMVQSCISGVIYICIVLAAIVFARQKFAAQKISS